VNEDPVPRRLKNLAQIGAEAAFVDRMTGRVVGIGHARDVVEVPDSLASKLPAESVEEWSTTNCGEVSAASRAIEAGSTIS